MRRLVAIAIILVILAGAWTAGWFWLAGWADRNAGAALANIRERGIEVECTDRRIVGFPFAMRVSCDAAEVTEPQSGLAAEVAGATGGASVFAPASAELRLRSPAVVAGAPLAEPAEFRWEEAALSVGMGMSGPRALSFDTAGFVTEVSLVDLPTFGVSVGEAQGTVSPSDNGGTVFAASFSGLAITAADVAFPPFGGSLAATLAVPPRTLLSGRAALQAPLAVEAIQVLIESGEARFGVDGDVSIDAEGIADGELRIRIAGAEALPAIIAALPEEYRREANAVAGGLIAFGQPTTLDGEPASGLVVTIERGEAKVGPVDVTLPRLPI